MASSVRVGAVLGRFQPLHVDHMSFIAAAAERVDELTIGVTRPFPDVAERGLHRVQPDSNPLPYWLRMRLIQEAVTAGIGRRVHVMPVPLVREAIDVAFAPETVFFTSVLDGWGDEKEAILRASQRDVVRLPVTQRSITGTEIRRLIRSGDETWRTYLPAGVSGETLDLVRDAIGARPRAS